MAVFNVPASPTIYNWRTTNFLGADFTTDSSAVDQTKSPNVQNMIRSVPGKIRKRMGYELITTVPNAGQVYAAHRYEAGNYYIIHAGANLYKYADSEFTLLYEGVAEAKTVSFEMNEKMVILDGNRALLYDGTIMEPLDTSSSVYIPKILISCNPDCSGGTSYENVNLISSYFDVSYVVTSDYATTTEFQLPYTEADAFTAELLQSDGTYTTLYKDTDFTVDTDSGTVTFNTAPGTTVSEGEDNLIIHAYKINGFSDYVDRINKCTIGILFGTDGSKNRLFISGNPNYNNYDWFSELYDMTYFPDLNYNVLGNETSSVMGYAILDNYIVTYKDYRELEQSVLIRQLTEIETAVTEDLSVKQATFAIVNALQGYGAYSKHCFNYFESEPVYLTQNGIYAITTQDITGNRITQNRSYFLDGLMLQEEDLANAFCCTYKDFYILCINSKCYILDGLQPLTDAARPYSTRLYAGFYFTNVPATAMWHDKLNDNLFFGDASGNIYKWYTDTEDMESYQDNGAAIEAIWETADIEDQLFYKNKTYRYIAIKCLPSISTGIKVYVLRRGIWELIYENNASIRYFSFSKLVFSKLTFKTAKVATLINSKIRVKKADYVKFRFVNDNLGDNLGILEFAVEYTQSGNHKN